MKCEECNCSPTDNSEKYYSVRTTITGIDLSNGLTDRFLCQECLETWIGTNGIGTIASLVRIYNPVATEDGI